jgi:hypothetical protein
VTSSVQAKHGMRNKEECATRGPDGVRHGERRQSTGVMVRIERGERVEGAGADGCRLEDWRECTILRSVTGRTRGGQCWKRYRI